MFFAVLNLLQVMTEQVDMYEHTILTYADNDPGAALVTLQFAITWRHASTHSEGLPIYFHGTPAVSVPGIFRHGLLPSVAATSAIIAIQVYVT